MEEHGFYVTLPCNASSWVYPQNRISSYTTRLPKAINLKGPWQVGLAEIEYPRSWYSFSDKEGYFTLNIDPDGDTIKKNKAIQLNIAGGYYPNIRAIIRVINQLIVNHGVLTHDEIKNKVFLAAKPNVSLYFRGRLGIILGAARGGYLGQSSYNKEADLTKTVMMHAPHQCDINAGFYTFYVYTDIIQYQVVGDSHVPLLRCVHISGKTNDTVIARYDKPHYASIAKDHITDIT
jgi:hypothetical protein